MPWPGAAAISAPAAPVAAAPAGLAIAVVGVVKEFGEVAALHEVSLTVEPGELLALLGPSGSGKTTLLRVIAGLETADRGQVLFGRQDATRLPVQQRQVGFVFQHYALFRHLSVADNIAYGLRARARARRPGEAEIRRRVGELLALVQLPGFERRFPAQLSGGQRQRVALARALAVEPRVLLLDEPFGALDAKVRKDLRGWLRAIHDRTGQTTVFVTHDQDEALELADRVAVLHRGRLEQVGSVDAVQDRPASPFVMRFLGDTAEFAGTVRAGRVEVNGRAVAVAVPAGLSGPVRLGCRPWHLALAAAGHGHVRGRVSGVRRQGGVRRVEVEGAGPARLELEVGLASPVQIGQTVDLAIQNAILFG